MDLILKSRNTSNESGDCEEKKRLFLRADATKKSVFWLDVHPDERSSSDANIINNNDASISQETNSLISISSPVEGVITRRVSSQDPSSSSVVEDQTYAWGGCNITSNAKSIEIYYIPPPSSPAEPRKETYLTTIKGIPASGTPNPDLFKAICAVPGGPRAVVAVRLKFLSLDPKGSLQFRLAALKWTARLITPSPARQTPMNKPQPSMPSNFSSTAALLGGPHGNGHGTESAGGSAHTESQQQKQQPEFLTREDIGAAMAGMTFALRSTEERMTAQLQKTVTSHQMLHQQVHALTIQISQQSQIIHNQSLLLQKQQDILAEHMKTIQSLQEGLERRSSASHDLEGTNGLTQSSRCPKPIEDHRNKANARHATNKKDHVPSDSLWWHYASIQM